MFSCLSLSRLLLAFLVISLTFTILSFRSLLAGALAGAVSRSFVSPLERLKMLFQTQGIPPTYTGVTQGLKLIYRQDGFLGYYKVIRELKFIIY